jgi:hypothetical protein
MKAFTYVLLVMAIISAFFLFGKNSEFMLESNEKENLLDARYAKLLAYPVDSMSFPRSYSWGDNTIKKVVPKDWTSGFFPGNLWILHQLSGNKAYKEKAMEWTDYMENEKYNDRTHDMGFKIFCSYGNGFKETNREDYKNIILKSAETLSTRFNKNVGCIRSWDFNSDIWEFPVIIDNMMNLELLFEATKLSGDSTYYHVAVSHANTTLDNHFREDGSSYHVLVYDTIVGKVLEKVTHQGINDESVWARGQAWGIYGYTMSYRYTKNPAYLERAESSANFFLNHDKLRSDGIPYWDFHDPAIPDAPRDVSAACIMASALLELASFTQNDAYADYSKKVIKSLISEEYILEADENAPYILDHSTGNWPKNDEIDGPIVYADYYFLESLLRSNSQ